MRVLYVCTGNSFRSPVAEALTRKFKPALEVESAGTDAEERVANVAKELLDQEEALEYVKPSPDQVSQRAIDDADLIVAMMPRHLHYLQQNFDLGDTGKEVWEVEDPVHPGVGAAESFEEVKQHVENLRDG